MKKRILLICNPVSGKGARGAKPDIAQELRLAGFDVDEYKTALSPADDEFIYCTAHMYDTVVCCGGDGTLNAVVNGLQNNHCTTPVLYLPTGTTNDLAKSLCLPNTVAESITPLEDNVSRPIDIGLFNGQHYFTYIASMGAFTDVSYTTPQEMKNWLGHTAYVWQGLTNLPKEMQPIQAKIYTEQAVYEDEFLFCSISNSTSIGGMLSLQSDEVQFDDGLFEVMLIGKPKNAQELWTIVRALKNRSYLSGKVPGIRFFHTSQLHVETTNHTPWTLDGEFGGLHKAIDVEVLANRVHLVGAGAGL